ncbi:MAG: hypothetical protein QOH26_706 [Actinomycetota bacterium]|nr:hypothetical protein [Actinomycetota bacterium]
MNLGRRIASLVVASSAALALVVVPTSPAAAASIWTEIVSGTTSDITAIEYQAADRFWFTTAAGEIFKRQAGGAFAITQTATGVPFNDIEFLPGGTTGFAVGNGGQVYRSTNSGDSWTSVNTGGAPIPVSKKSSLGQCNGSEPLGDVNAVRFAGTARVWIFAEGAQMARSQSAGDLGGAGTWEDANRDTQGTPSTSDDTCKLEAGTQGIDDAFFVPTNPDTGYICTAFFGKVYLTVNNLASQASERAADCGNGNIPDRRMAGDPANPNRGWAVGPGDGTSYTKYTQDGWQTSSPFAIGNSSARGFTSPFDVDYADGTVLTAGSEGMILNSDDGTTFFYNEADGALASNDWHAVGLATADDGAVGGAGGKLVLTTTASKTSVKPPETSLKEAPKSTTDDRTPTFRFSSNEAGATFECKMDGSPFAACTSPKTYGRLSGGKHSFRVRAIDADGNVDATPARKDFRVTPQTTIRSGPKARTTDRTPTFKFRANVFGSTFKCKMDGRAYKKCTSPKAYGRLSFGKHVFSVKAIDKGGHADPTPAKREFKIIR